MPFREINTSGGPKPPTRLVTGAWGGPKEGKTTFLLSHPSPIYLFNFNFGYEELLDKPDSPAAGKKLYVSDWALPEQFMVENYWDLVMKLLPEYHDAMRQANEAHGTVAVDLHSQMWQMIGPTMREKAENKRYEKWAAGDKKRPFKDIQTDWADPNLMMGALTREPLQYPNVNAVFLADDSPVYTQFGEATDDRKYHGFKEMPAIVQEFLYIFTDSQPIMVNGLPTGKFNVRTMGRLERSRHARDMQGYVMPDPTYDSLMELISP